MGITTKKLTVEEQKGLYPDDEIRELYLKRPDIKGLSPEEQEQRWQEHLKALNKFREMLSGIDAIIL